MCSSPVSRTATTRATARSTRLAADLQGQGHDPRRLVVCAQNHDQVGNRAVGDRLSPEALRVAAAVDALLAVHAAALHGRGDARAASVPVLHRPHRPGYRRGDARGAQAGVRGVRVVLGEARARIRRRSRRSCARSCRSASRTRSTASCSRCAASCRASSDVDVDEEAACCACAAAAVEVVADFRAKQVDIRR